MRTAGALRSQCRALRSVPTLNISPARRCLNLAARAQRASYTTAPLRRAALPALFNKIETRKYATAAAAAEADAGVTNADLLTPEEIIARMSPEENARLDKLRNIGIAVRTASHRSREPSN